MNLSEMQTAIHKTAKEHGWWEPQPANDVYQYGSLETKNLLVQRTFGDLVALCHSELSEALEAFRYRGLDEWVEYPDSLVQEVGLDKAAESFAERGMLPKNEGAFTELGDCIIRILDMAAFYNVDMQEIVERKMVYNESRPYRHGGKKL
jgi:hypothetical protein